MNVFTLWAADTDLRLLRCWHGTFKMSRVGRFKTNIPVESSGTSLDLWCGQRSPGVLKFSYSTRVEFEGKCSPCPVPLSRLSVTALTACHVFLWKVDTKTASAELTRCCTHQCLTSLSMFRSETRAVCLTPVVLPTLPPFFIGRLFVCLWWCPCFCSIIQDVFFFVSFYRQHASTNATMVFKANCDVHYFHCCLILFRLFSSRIDWQANSPPFFLCCDLCSLSSLSAVFCPPWTYSTNNF